MLTPQFALPLHHELVVDLFAGGGGASTGIEQAIGRHVDIAVNHNPDAVGMHEMNHPQTKHFCSDVFEVDPLEATGGQLVGLLHASPDCTHHSQALGGQPRSRAIRSLAWAVHKWVGKTKPRVVTLENVKQMLLWAPLVAKRCPDTRRVLTLEIDPTTGKNRVARPGERVPVHDQWLVPCPKRTGRNWTHFVEGLRAMGATSIEWCVICNADMGAHSTRERLYVVARFDGQPVVWPQQTHAKRPKKGQQAWRPAHECIDWSIEGRSIFDRPRPLAEATMKRIAVGLKRYVLDAAEPFIAPLRGTSPAHKSVHSINDPLSTVIAGGTHHALVSPTLVQVGYGEREGQAARALDLGAPLGTVVAGGIKHALASAYLVQAGHGEGKGSTKRRSHGVNDINGPVGTITASGGGQSLATAFMVQANGGFNTTPARDLRQPMSTVTTSGSQQQMVEVKLSRDQEAGALRCAAFLMRYHGTGGQWADLRDPATTVTTHDRLALVTVWLRGEPWVIVDITLRMLVPRELYNAQDFPATYIIDRTAAGKLLTKTAQVHMCGNSVSPLPMHRIVAANYREQWAQEIAA